MGVVGLWACPEEKGRSYAAEVHSTIDAYEHLLRSRPWLLAGDFNLTPGGEADGRSAVTARLNELGYESAYHAFHGVNFGDEPPTYYHQFNREKPFHLDLEFVPRSGYQQSARSRLRPSMAGSILGRVAATMSPSPSTWTFNHSDDDHHPDAGRE